MRPLKISTAGSRFDVTVKPREISWQKWIEVTNKPKVTAEKFADYLKFDPSKQLETKDVGYFVGGTFNGGQRKRDHLFARSMVTLDVDHAPADFIEHFDFAYSDLAFIIHSSHKHSIEKPRLRLIFPLSRDALPEEYEPLARKLAQILEIEWFDITTFEPARVMFLPSRSVDGEWFHYVNEGQWVDVDAVLGQYNDWHDMKEWPVSKKETDERRKISKAADPLAKPGIIGAFNRAYTISRVLDELIPGSYIPTRNERRWTYHKSTSKEGAIIYDDDTLLYSNHESDPCYRHSVNAFDLYRLHAFGESDKGAKASSPTQAPSFLAVVRAAMALPEVVAELDGAPATLGRDPEAIAGALESAFTVGSDDAEPGAVGSPAAANRGAPTGDGAAGDGGLRTPSIDDEEPDSTRAATKDAVAALGREIIDCWDGDTLLERMVPKIAGLKLDPIAESRLIDLFVHHFHTISEEKLRLRAVIKRVTELRAAAAVKAVGGFADHELEDQLVRYILRHRFNNGNHILFMGKHWYTYESGYWYRTEQALIENCIQLALLQLKNEESKEDRALYQAMTESGRAEYFTALVGALSNNMAAKCARDSETDPLGLTRSDVPSVMNVEGAELWFNMKTGAIDIRPQSWDSLQTTKLNSKYDPDAKCPRWDAAVADIFSKNFDPDDVVRHFYEIGGYMLQPTRNDPIALIMRGPGGNGKTLLFKIITKLLGFKSSAAISLASVSEQNNAHFTDSLLGKLLILDDDWKQGALLPDDWIKKLSEQKQIDANPKFGTPYKFVCRTIPVILANGWPYTLDLSEGLRRRMQVFEMKYRVPDAKMDRGLSTYIERHELSGVLNHFIKGWQRVCARGGRLLIPEECVEAKTKWMAKTNVVASFAAEMLTAGDAGSPPVAAAAIYNAFVGWCQSEEQTMKHMPRMKFFSAIEALGFERRVIHNQAHYVGVTMRTDVGFSVDE